MAQHPKPILSVEGLSKSFGGIRALHDVTFAINAGEVHALLGHNGSGKSTLIKILSGYHTADSGSVTLRGEKFRSFRGATELRRPGISFVHQDLGLVETLSVLDNLRVGRYDTGVGWRIRWRTERHRTQGLLRRFGLDLDPDTPVRRLPRAERTVVGVIRALQDIEAETESAGLLVLDEPTASLPAHEVELLFGAIRRVAESGSAVLFVTHNLDEVFRIADRVSVLRDGELVTTRRAAELDERALITLILGHEIAPRSIARAKLRSSRPNGTPVMQVQGLRGRTVEHASFEVYEGEILGLTGLIGAGHDEVPYLIYGGQPLLGGKIGFGDRWWTKPSPKHSKHLGLAFLPADRQRQSGVPRATVRENVTIPSLTDYRTRSWGLDRRRELSDVADVLHRFDVSPPEPDRRLATLSGGNQQKALLAKWLRMRPRVLLLHEPTQGIDVGGRDSIFEMLRENASAGMSVVCASAEYEDLAELCDRVVVFRGGKISRELSGEALSQNRITEECYRTDP